MNTTCLGQQVLLKGSPGSSWLCTRVRPGHQTWIGDKAHMGFIKYVTLLSVENPVDIPNHQLSKCIFTRVMRSLSWGWAAGILVWWEESSCNLVCIFQSGASHYMCQTTCPSCYSLWWLIGNWPPCCPDLLEVLHTFNDIVEFFWFWAVWPKLKIWLPQLHPTWTAWPEKCIASAPRICYNHFYLCTELFCSDRSGR